MLPQLVKSLFEVIFRYFDAIVAVFATLLDSISPPYLIDGEPSSYVAQSAAFATLRD